MGKRLLYIAIIFIVAIVSAHAEVVVLRSGQSIKGEILLNNEEVIILRKKDGSRYQYPKQEVVEIQIEKAPTISTSETASITPSKAVEIRAQVQAGAAYVPYIGWGGNFQFDAALGTHQIQGKDIFLGGSIGYHTLFGLQETYSWIPLQLVAQWAIPLSRNTPHYPMVAATIGYGFATKRHWSGGICTGINVGWGYRMNQNSSVSVAATAQWQQTQITITETINHIPYNNTIGCPILCLGAKIGIQF